MFFLLLLVTYNCLCVSLLLLRGHTSVPSLLYAPEILTPTLPTLTMASIGIPLVLMKPFERLPLLTLRTNPSFWHSPR